MKIRSQLANAIIAPPSSFVNLLLLSPRFATAYPYRRTYTRTPVRPFRRLSPMASYPRYLILVVLKAELTTRRALHEPTKTMTFALILVSFFRVQFFCLLYPMSCVKYVRILLTGIRRIGEMNCEDFSSRSALFLRSPLASLWLKYMRAVT